MAICTCKRGSGGALELDVGCASVRDVALDASAPLAAVLREPGRRLAQTRLLRSLVVVLAVLGLALVSLHGVRAAPDHSLTGSTSSVTLSDDDRGSAMFDVSGMAPGDLASRCIRVAYSGAGSPAVNLYGQTAGSGLDQRLRMTVEQGQGGDFDSCKGFRGAPIFEGTFADFARAHPSFEHGLPTAVGSAPERERSFRIRLRLQGGNEAQGRTAKASFTWQTHQAREPVPPGPAGFPPSAASPGAAPRSDTSTRGPGAGAVTPRKRRGRHGEGAAPSTTPRKRLGESQSGATRAGGRDKRGIVADIARAASYIGQRSAFPLLLFLIVLFFLGVQDRIDRRDPKLALAPLSDEPYLRFGVPPDGEGR